MQRKNINQFDCSSPQFPQLILLPKREDVVGAHLQLIEKVCYF